MANVLIIDDNDTMREGLAAVVRRMGHKVCACASGSDALQAFVGATLRAMNEITADMNGEILEVLVGNGEAVEYNQPLFTIRPIR